MLLFRKKAPSHLPKLPNPSRPPLKVFKYGFEGGSRLEGGVVVSVATEFLLNTYFQNSKAQRRMLAVGVIIESI